MTPFLDISRISKRFVTDGAVFEALKDVDLKIAEGEFITLIGHSGCGKSTVLNILAGLLDVTDGGIFWKGRKLPNPVRIERWFSKSRFNALVGRIRQCGIGGESCISRS